MFEKSFPDKKHKQYKNIGLCKIIQLITYLHVSQIFKHRLLTFMTFYLRNFLVFEKYMKTRIAIERNIEIRRSYG